MKLVNMPIGVVAWLDKTGVPRPVRFRVIREDNDEKVIKLSKNMLREKVKQGGIVMDKLNCSCVLNGVQRVLEIRYYLENTKWMLFKI